MLEGDAVMELPLVALACSPICRIEFEAVLVTVTLPLIHPVFVGANRIVSVVVCPAPKTVGRDNPETLNPAALTVTAEIVTLVVPLFLSVANCASVCDTATDPKRKLAGELLSCCVVRA